MQRNETLDSLIPKTLASEAEEIILTFNCLQNNPCQFVVLGLKRRVRGTTSPCLSTPKIEGFGWVNHSLSLFLVLLCASILLAGFTMALTRCICSFPPHLVPFRYCAAIARCPLHLERSTSCERQILLHGKSTACRTVKKG